MAVRIADIFANLSVKTDDYDRGLSAAQGRASAFGGVLQGIFQGVGQRLFTGIVNGLETVVSKMGAAVTASSSLAESQNQVGAIFGSSASKVLEFASTADTALGQSKHQALDAAATFATFGKSAGLSGDALVKFATNFDTLASDMASFKNTTPEEAITAIGAALRGESEPIRRYGVLLDDATLRQEALKLGIVDTTANALTPQQRVLAAQAAIYRQTIDLQGDFARTSGELANGQRILAAEVENGAARLGNAFRPAVAEIQNILIGLLPQMFSYGQNITDQLANGLAAGIRAIIPVIQTVRQLFTYWFAPGSPPRVLPDIDKWGAAAMGQFLGGFSSVDVKGAFDTVGKAIESILRSNVAAGKGSENGLVGAVFGTRNAIQNAVAEFARAGSVSEATINKITRAAGVAGPGISALVKAYFNLQSATTAATRAQDDLNRITDEYDAILTPLQGKLDSVRAEQRKLADQQRLIAAQNVLTNFDSTAAEKRAAQLDIEQIQLEDQISTVESQKKAETGKAQAQLDGAKKAETAAQKQLDIAQATIDQQVEVNNLLAEQKRLVEQLAAAQDAAAKKAQAEAEQAANKAEQLAAKQQREVDQLAAAQLRYRLQVSDTAGDIAIMEGELAKLTPGTVEYFDVLTQLDSLHKQYNAELERAAKAAGALGTTDIGAGLQGGITGPLGEASEAGKNLAKALQEAFAPVGPASAEVIKLGESIRGVVSLIGEVTGIDLSGWLTGNTDATSGAATGWDMYGERVAADTASAQAAQDAHVAAMQTAVGVIKALIAGDWNQLWLDYKAYALTAYGDVDADTVQKLGHIQFVIDLFQSTTNLTWGKYFDQWNTIFTTGWGYVIRGFDTALGNITTQITNFGTAFYNGGTNLIGQFWDGLKAKWGELSSWFTSSLAGLRAQLPFSEPKDPSSPLRGLAKSGESMVNIIQGGMDKASFSIAPLANSLLPSMATAGATSNDNRTSNSNVTQILNFYGKADPEMVRKAAASGVDDILGQFRSTGLG